jgi:CAAX prenyl protease-like protein
VGVVVWIGLCRLNLESRLLEPLGLKWFVAKGTRSGFNPLEKLSATPGWAWGFLAIRFFGLVLVVPLVEEFFLRGWAMRYFVAPDWWKVPIGEVSAAALAVGTILPMLAHPGELFAAAVWFSLVTWLMVKTRNIWDCVLAHAITNLLLGIYVVYSGQWQLL